MENTLFNNLCRLFGASEEEIEKLSKTFDGAFDKIQKLEKNPLNPKNKSDEQLEAEGWELVESVNEDKDGYMIKSRTWRKSSDSKPECTNKQCAKEDTEIKFEKEFIDRFMHELNGCLLHNWSESNSQLSKPISSIIDNIFNNQECDSMKLWQSCELDNCFQIGADLDDEIFKKLKYVDSLLTELQKVINSFSKESVLNLSLRVSNFIDLLISEVEDICHVATCLTPDYIPITKEEEVYSAELETPHYSMIYTFYSMLVLYLDHIASKLEKFSKDL